MNEDNPIWFRRRGEPTAAYEAFKVFRGTLTRGDEDPPSKGVYIDENEWIPTRPRRDLQQVSVIVGKSYGSIQQYASRYNWTERTAAYDEYLDNALRDEIARAMRLKALECVKLRDREFDRIVGEVATFRSRLDRMLELLDHMYVEKKSVEKRYEDGRPYTINIYKPVKWRVSDLLKLSKVSAEMMQRAFELALGPDHDRPTVEAEDDPLPPELAALLLRNAPRPGTNGEAHHDEPE
jgi:hypothetical protein